MPVFPRFIAILTTLMLVLTTLGGFAGGRVLARTPGRQRTQPEAMVTQADLLPALELTPNGILTGATAHIQVTGTSFVPGSTITLWLGQQTVVGSAAITDTGVLSTTVTIPSTAVGQYEVRAVDTTGATLASQPLYVTGLDLSATSAPPASHVTASGEGFLPSQPVTIQFANQSVATATTTITGTFSGATFVVPPVANGTYDLRIQQTTSPTLTVQTSFTVTPVQATVALTPTAVQPNADFSVSGSGYPLAMPVTIKLDTAILGSLTTSNSGSLPTTKFTLPQGTAAGAHTLSIDDSSGRTLASTTLTVLGAATLAVNPTSGVAGQTVTVSGTGFQAGEPVALSVNNAAITTATAGAQGQISASFALPEMLAVGNASLTAKGEQSQTTGSATFTVQGATLSLGATSIVRGGAVTVVGHGFGAHETVALQLGSSTVSSVTADSSGSFNTTLTIPSSQQTGSLSVTAIGQGSHHQASTSVVVVAAPVAPAPVVPVQYMRLSASAVAVGSTFMVYGYAFGGNEPVTLAVSGRVLGTVQTTTYGAFTASFTMPTTVVGGTTSITATGAQSQRTASVPVTVMPALKVSFTTSSVQVGTSFTLTGFGFAANQPVSLSIPGATPVTVSTNGQGTFSTTVKLPLTEAAGKLTITATSLQTHHVAQIPVTVSVPTAKLALGGSYAVAGSSFQASGSGFWPGEPVQIRVQNTLLSTITTDANGGFTNVSMTLPGNLASGGVAVTATGAKSHKVASTTLSVFAHTGTLSVSPSQFVPGTQVRITGSGFLPNEAIALAVGGASPFATARADAHGNFALNLTLPATAATGSVTLTASGESSHITAMGTARLQLLAPPTVGSTTWYFAAGRTDAGYSEQIALLNPSTQTVNGTITFYYGNDQMMVRSFSLRPQARSTVNVQTLTGISGPVAVKIQASRPIAVARTTQRGGVDVMAARGVSAPSKTWYFAEGYTGLTFKEDLVLFNPGAQAAHVHITWPQFNGKAAVTRDVTLVPQSRQTIDVNAFVQRASHATVVTADQPIVASRTMTFGALGNGAFAKTGATQASTTLYFAEGSTANGFQEYLTILNPDSTRQAVVTAQFYGASGRSIGTKTVVIDPLHRANIKVNDIVTISTVSTVLHSTLPIVAERSMYFGAPNSANIGGTVVFGQPSPAMGWAFARGNTLAGQSEFELLFNPNRTASIVEATYYLDNGQVVPRVFTVGANSRMNIDVTKTVPEVGHGYHGVVLRSTNGVSFLAEQAIYTNNMSHGAATLGTPVQ
jgi:hypothetical protein